MKEMILDTSSSYLYIAFRIDGEIKFESITEGKNNHSDNLLKIIKEGLNELSLEVKDFDRIISGFGPGMYTGLRVSLTVAKTFAWTLEKDLFVFSSLDLLTSGYFKEDGKYLVMMKAKKDYSYTKAFEIKNGKYNLLAKEEFLANEEFLNKYDLNEYNVLDNSCIKINYQNMSEEMLKKVDNVHALEPNYLREDVI